MISSPAKIVTPVWARISRITGSPSTTSPIAPVHAIGLRPMRSESIPSSGIVTRATTMTAICSSCEVVAETPAPLSFAAGCR